MKLVTTTARKEMEVSLQRVFNLIDLDGNGNLEKEEVFIEMLLEQKT